METLQAESSKQSLNELPDSILRWSAISLLLGFLLYAEALTALTIGCVALLATMFLLMFLPMTFGAVFYAGAKTTGFKWLGVIFGLTIFAAIFWLLIRPIMVGCLVRAIEQIIAVF